MNLEAQWPQSAHRNGQQLMLNYPNVTATSEVMGHGDDDHAMHLMAGISKSENGETIGCIKLWMTSAEAEWLGHALITAAALARNKL